MSPSSQLCFAEEKTLSAPHSLSSIRFIQEEEERKKN